MSQLGVIGLGTMGANLARNAARNGAIVAVFNRHGEKTDAFIQTHGSEGSFVACLTLEELRNALTPPRAILLMVKAGEAVDEMIDELAPMLEPGDIVIDGGNSNYLETEKRVKSLKRKKIHFVGLGVSGGEEGALRGPSMMPGGDREAVTSLLPLLSAMAASDGSGGKCVAYMGPKGTGHFVKMVHNGIEYGIMQLIAEAYAILKSLGLKGEALAQTFEQWNSGDLQSYLIEITGKVLQKKDPETGAFLVEMIKDEAGQKGTGRWTTEAALRYGTPIPTITAAVEARGLSADKERRTHLSTAFPLMKADSAPVTADDVRKALSLSILLTYAQGFQLLEHASREEKWKLPMAEIARIWRGGCIIRSSVLELFQNANMGSEADRKWHKEAFIKRFAGSSQQSWRTVASFALCHGISAPALTASIAFYDAMRSASLPQNLIQAQRDFFGAHGFERIDKSGIFHVQWE